MNTSEPAAAPGPRTIDVTGLTPEAVNAVADVVRAFRGQPAAPPDGPPPNETAAEWVARLQAWSDSQPVRDIVIDDSRESIYEGCGE